MGRARKLGINVPFILNVDLEKHAIMMQFIDG